MKILIVEDDLKTAELLSEGFAGAGFETDRAMDGLSGLRMAGTGAYSAAVVDVMLPKMDGFQLVSELRRAGSSLPILILSARDSVENKVTGLEKGGDDYLSKPFSFSELLARIQALLRRAGHSAEPTVLSVRDLTLDLTKRKVRRGGESVELQPLEFQLLEYLVRNHGQVVSKNTILEHVWDYHFDTQSNIVEAAVFRLRDKIDKPFRDKMIRTIRGFGYVLE